MNYVDEPFEMKFFKKLFMLRPLCHYVV